MAKDILRRCRFAPYRRGMGPTFTLTTWATGRYDDRGQEWIGYRLTMRERGVTTILFDAENYSPSPMDPIDSDAAIEGLMGFLTLRPGDTDAEFFAGDTPEVTSYREQHAESLSCEVMARYCDENGNVRRVA